ncbi:MULTISPECIES: LysM peptidoglycan-binding domain-containing protein [unclassified Anaeromyxobacter]|uniref:LysM peptidoglycan-binding domain-containing protein n=1 Tax=unclassified Anaeromyxobacter TaxID=2620896 RepID=UPI001F58FB25|nr:MULTISPECIES: LysM peptidoglycan-binding domain-containing protein [unclassified Anaeromyxobacter]
MIRRHLVAVLALLPAAALAQAGALDAARDAARTASADPQVEATGAVQDGAPSETAAAVPADAAGAPAAGEEGLAPAVAGTALALEDAATSGGQTPDTYTIRPGDTLWDLSGRYLNNPWYWPKIWSYNPDIENPHWIYPGNLLRFYPSADEGPTRVEPAGEPVAEAEEAPPRELEDLSRADGKSDDDGDAVAVVGPYKIGYVSPRALLARHDTFVTPRELAESGAIKAAFEEKLMLSSHDKAYARFERRAEVKPGETYVIFKTERPIRHPRTNELFGWQSTVLGAAKVVAVDDKAATLVITQSFEPIERGAMLGPWTERFLRRVDRRANRRALEGTIVGGQVQVVTQLGEHHVVFIDRGSADGVEEGNVFTAVRAGDPYGRAPGLPAWDSSLPKEDIGEMLVIDVKERASAALVTRSLVELAIGDRVEMRAVRSAAEGAGGR